MSRPFASAVEFTPVSALVIGFVFFNTFLLPLGLLYTTLLTPLFVWVLLRKGRWKPLFVYGAFSLVFAYFHQRAGADMAVYLKSYILFSSVVLFSIWVYYQVVEQHLNFRTYFKDIVVANAFLTLIAICVSPIAFAREVFWSYEPIHRALPIIPRLKMLVYEPSFYAFLLVPVFLYFFASVVINGRLQDFLALSLLTVSLLLSLSFGVLGGLVLATLLVLGLHFKWLVKHKRAFFTFLYLFLGFTLAVYLAVGLFPDNPIVDRAGKVLQGHDSSANGRTWEAFLLAWRILEKTDYLFGAGLGQVKIIGHEIIVDYYNYDGKWADLVRIPNVLAETLATFGILGVLVRLLAQIILFLYTKVYENFYRLLLFTFVFIYQFTGSYLTNIYEYLMWIIVFIPVFPEFNKQRFP